MCFHMCEMRFFVLEVLLPVMEVVVCLDVATVGVEVAAGVKDVELFYGYRNMVAYISLYILYV